MEDYSVLLYSVLFYSILGCTFSLHETDLRRSPPTFPVLCYPCPYCSLFSRNVVSPTDLIPFICDSVLFMIHLLSFIRVICPAHFHFALVMYSAMSLSLGVFCCCCCCCCFLGVFLFLFLFVCLFVCLFVLFVCLFVWGFFCLMMVQGGHQFIHSFSQSPNVLMHREAISSSTAFHSLLMSSCTERPSVHQQLFSVS